MPPLLPEQLQIFETSYIKLQELIKERQHFESAHDYPPYSLYRTTINFTNIDGKSLLWYAAAMGDLEKVKTCIHHTAINLKDESNIKAINIALINGHFDVAKYLFEQGIDCANVDLALCRDDKIKAWFSEKIHTALSESFPDPGSDINYPQTENQFFVKFSLYTNTAQLALKRAIEIGDIEFIKKALDSKDIAYLGVDSLLVVAAKYGQFEIVKLLVAKGADINSKKPYSATALIEAILNNHQEIIDFLLSHNADVNKEDEVKNTALSYALFQGNWTLVNKLVQLGAVVSKKNINGNNILHLAITNNPGGVGQLLTIPGVTGLIKEKNIYGFTPLDIAIQNKNDEVIKLLSSETYLRNLKQTECGFLKLPDKFSKESLNQFSRSQYILTDAGFFFYNKLNDEIETIKLDQSKLDQLHRYFSDDKQIEILSNKQLNQIRSITGHIRENTKYGNKPTAIKQGNVMVKMLYYLTSHYRDTSYFSAEGNCNGFSFLKSMYAARDMEKYFFDTLAIMANWDGTEKSLTEEFKDISQATYYNNLEKLFERWINDVTWFQHSTLANIDSLTQRERLEQYSVIGDKKEYEPQSLYKEGIYINEQGKTAIYERTGEQLAEIFSYLMRMPKNTHFELSGGGNFQDCCRLKQNRFALLEA